MESPKALLPHPPPEIPPNVVPVKIQPVQSIEPRSGPLIARSSPGSKGRRVSLMTNHLHVSVVSAVPDFYHYDILVCYEDGSEVKQKNTKMAVIEKLHEVYESQLDGKALIFDGVRSLFTPGALPQNNLEFNVVLTSASAKGLDKDGDPSANDQKRQKLSPRSKTFVVQLKYVSKISMQSLNDSKCGRRIMEPECLRILDTILQQQALKQGCLVVCQSSFFHDPKNYIELGGGILGCRGFFSSFRALQGGLYLNHDVSMTAIVQPGSVVEFLMSNQNVKTPFNLDWNKAIQTLKSLRMKVNHLHREFKITGLSEKSCKEQKFSLKLGEARTVETTVYDYFVKTRGIELKFSADLPCINVGRPRQPVLFPVELCFLVPLQRYRKELNGYQVSAMIRKSSQKPEDLVKYLSDDLKRIKRETGPLLQSCGVSIDSFVRVEGRVLSAPRLKMGNGEQIIPRNGFWNIKDKKFVDPKRLENWAVVNFSTSCNVRNVCVDLARVGSTKGMVISPPLYVFDENPKNRKKPPSVRVEMMFQQIQSKFHQKPPQFILCLLADKKFCDLYGPWKRKTIIEFGIRDQCFSSSKIDESYLMNVLLKINVKLGGLNHAVVSESMRTIPLVSKIPTMIFGIHVSHTAPGRADTPSIASVVGSREWPRISSYRASVCALPPKVQVIDSLFKPMSEHENAGILRELLMEFYMSSGQKRPAQIIIFRNGLSSSDFKRVLKVEMDQFLKACNFLEEKWRPKFTVIVAQRRHHTKFFDSTSSANIPPGTIVDSKVCDLQYNNFYMSPHAARIGTSRPTHYHVLLDEIGFSADDLQELVHSLSYVFQRSNNTISEVAPIRYARLAAAKISQAVKPDKMVNDDTYESKGGCQLPKVHKNVASSMFFI